MSHEILIIGGPNIGSGSLEIEAKSRESSCNLNIFWYLNEVDGLGSVAKNGSLCKSPNETDNSIVVFFSLM